MLRAGLILGQVRVMLRVNSMLNPKFSEKEITSPSQNNLHIFVLQPQLLTAYMQNFVCCCFVFLIYTATNKTINGILSTWISRDNKTL